MPPPQPSPESGLSRREMLAGAALAFALSGCRSDGALDGLPEGPEAKVASILAGDLAALQGGGALRLAGVAAPRNREPYAEAAADALDALAAGRTLRLFFSGARTDASGAALAQAEDADSRLWLQGALLSAGAARVRTTADNHAGAAAMLAREAEARRARRGLWTIPDYDVRLPEEVGSGDAGFLLVEGRVLRVGRGREAAYLDFSTDWREGFSVRIARTDAAAFERAGFDMAGLEGRLIRVRGVVQARQMTVDHPQQIERLRG
jgi:endonuclease YncB( thermonuclease family)